MKETFVMEDTLLLRMRQSGWFDICLLALAISILLLALGLVGVIQYNYQMGRMPADFNAYQIDEALGHFAHAKQTYLGIGGTVLAVTLFGFFLLALGAHFAPNMSLKSKQRF